MNRSIPPDNASLAYQSTSVATANQNELLALLYEGAVRFLREAMTAIEAKDLKTKARTCDKALAIVQHLNLSLDPDNGGEIARELERLYAFVITKIVEGSTQLGVAPLEEAIAVLNTLGSAWRELATRDGSDHVPEQLLAATGQGRRLTLHG